MILKDTLLVLTTYPRPTTAAAIRFAVGFAEFMNCRITAFVAEIKIELPGTLFGNSLLSVSGLAAAEMRKSRDNAQSLIETFNAEAARHGITHEVVRERELVADIPRLIAEYSRLKDLTIIPMPTDDFVGQWDAEAVIFKSGRPILVLPEDQGRSGFKADTIAVGWDFSRAAARAIADAMPILERAKTVRVVTVVNEKTFDVFRATHEIGTYLARHGVNVSLDQIDATGRHIGDVLKEFSAAHKVDLFVMGAYGHSRFREFMLGGATRSMLAAPPTPLLLSH